MNIIRAKELQRLIGLSRTTIWRMERTGSFPRRVRLGINTVGWMEDEILAWLAARPRGMTSQQSV